MKIKWNLDEIDQYCAQSSSSIDPVCSEVFDFTNKNVDFPQMMVGDLEGAFLNFLVHLTGAKRVLEIGCFTGFSSLSMAGNLPKDGELITLELDPERAKIAQGFWDKSENGSLIKVMVGAALESMQKLSGSFDLIFIDANKQQYADYFEKSLELLSDGGLIVLDNILWDGKVLQGDSEDLDTQGILKVTEMIKKNPSLQKVMLPIRDGLYLVQKRKA